MRTRTAFRVWRVAIAVSCAAGSIGCIAEAGDWTDRLRDPEDGRIDGGGWLLGKKGVLPVPVIITEPAIGYGGGAALLFFHQPQSDEAQPPAQPPDGRFVPPSVSGVVAAVTDNGTKIGAVGHLGIWKNNSLRFTGVAGAMSLNLKFYGANDYPRFDEGIDYNISGWGFLSQLVWRLGDTDMWLGPQLVYLRADTSLNEGDVPSIFDSLNGKVSNTGIGFAFSYDTRDNIFTPSHGFQSDWFLRQHTGNFHGAFEYAEVNGRNRWYIEPARKWVLGMRLDVSFTSGDVPFYALPSINQRGISKAQFQGGAVMDAEVETRYDFDGRWFAVAFVGTGRAADNFSKLDTAEDRVGGGVGGRYLLARQLGLQVGIDIAKGPEEWAYYLQIGGGWSF